MKLLNSDKLREEVYKIRKQLVKAGCWTAEHNVEHYIGRLIDEAPEVDAVPMDWLKEFLTQSAYENIVRGWLREKETRDEGENVKKKDVKITAFTYGQIPEDEFEKGYFLDDAIQSIIDKTAPEDWIYADMEVIEDTDGEHE